jgi:hypothetical protein
VSAIGFDGSQHSQAGAQVVFCNVHGHIVVPARFSS